MNDDWQQISQSLSMNAAQASSASMAVQVDKPSAMHVGYPAPPLIIEDRPPQHRSRISLAAQASSPFCFPPKAA